MLKAFFAAFAALAVFAAAIASSWPSFGAQLGADSSDATPTGTVAPTDGGTSLGVQLPGAFELGVGDRVTLPDRSVLTFLEKVQDSRCPADAMCIWQGNAVLAFDYDGARFEVTWGAIGDGVATFSGYQLAITNAQPYPLASQPHDFADTVVTITVTEA